MPKTYSDGTRTITYEQANTLLKEMDEDRRHENLESAKFFSNSLNIAEVNLSKPVRLFEFLTILIGASGPLFGNIRLQKETFIAVKERLPKDLEIEDPQFVPYRIGPYSFKLASIIDGLLIGGYVKYTGKKGSNRQAFSLTSKGKELYTDVTKKNPRLVRILKKLRNDMDEFSVDGILRYVYNNPDYSHYLLKSAYRERYKDITWGRGRG